MSDLLQHLRGYRHCRPSSFFTSGIAQSHLHFRFDYTWHVMKSWSLAKLSVLASSGITITVVVILLASNPILSCHSRPPQKLSILFNAVSCTSHEEAILSLLQPWQRLQPFTNTFPLLFIRTTRNGGDWCMFEYLRWRLLATDLPHPHIPTVLTFYQ